MRTSENVALTNRAGLVLTNGTTLDDDVVRLLHKHGPFRLYVSLMGATPATHDQVTRCPGSFDQMRAGVERLHRLAQSGTRFCFNVLVHRANQHEL
jgi:MoaA/NifB/PqqE/SkfB family radical SAM enzyme